MDAALLAILACPKCRNSLAPASPEKDEGLVCGSCAVVYPILDDIPVLLIEEAIPLPDWQAGKRGKGGSPASG